MESMEACSMAVPLNLRFSQVDKGGGHNYIGPPGGWRWRAHACRTQRCAARI